MLYHAKLTVVAVGNGVLNEVSPLPCHAFVKSTLYALVPSFASAGNDVRAEQPFHADVKLEQFLMSVVLTSLSDVLLYHAKVTEVAEGRSELKLLSDEQLYHA